jgi:mRNA-degrading endonuclease YafQ of YafQ-DinJ toxin-antitoxin module
MLSSKDYVRESLELNLFFVRILKEHLIFAASVLTPRDSALIPTILNLKNRAEALLIQIVALSNGVVRPEALSSGEFVTQYTLMAEQKTQFYTGLPIDMRITQAEANLRGSTDFTVTPELEQNVNLINREALSIANIAISMQTMALNEVLSCKMFTTMYPLMMKHVTDEAKHYVEMLTMLQKRADMHTISEAIEHELFWDIIMGQHAQFIRGMLDPSENDLINTANNFVKEFAGLANETKQAMDQLASFQKVTRNNMDATTRIRDFKVQGTHGILECKIRSIILPLLSDHVLREANHYLRMLKMFSTMS